MLKLPQSHDADAVGAVDDDAAPLPGSSLPETSVLHAQLRSEPASAEAVQQYAGRSIQQAGRLERASAGGRMYPTESRARVLVVDANAESVTRITGAMDARDFEIVVLPSGREVVEARRGGSEARRGGIAPDFDLVLVDMELPDITSFDLLALIKTQSDGSIPVVFIAPPTVTQLEIAEMLNRGADSYLVRPIEEHMLMATVRMLLRTTQAERDKRALLKEIRTYGQRLNAIVDSLPGIVWETRGTQRLREHTLSFISSYFENTLGHRSEEWIGKALAAPQNELPPKEHMGHAMSEVPNETGPAWFTLLHPEDINHTIRAMERVLDTRTASHFEFRIFASDGRIVPLETYLSPLLDARGRAIGLRAVSMDISERKRNEEELRRARDQAETASRAKDQFIAVLSHELRTPLTPVLSTLEMLEMESDFPVALRPSIDMLKRNVELEARLIDDLLDLTRLTKGQLSLTLEPIDLHAVVRNVAEICRKEVRAKRLELRLQCDASRAIVQGDEARLQQVIWNLVHNAIKFTPEGGTITIRTRLRSEESGELPGGQLPGGPIAIEVNDTGIGIDPTILPNVFNPFEQGDMLLTRQFGGLGLGLTITQNLVSLHGGTISARSRGRNLGSSFIVELPVIPAERVSADPEGAGTVVNEHAFQEAQQKAEAEAQHKPRILLVDDHADTGRVIQVLLERRGFEVERALNVSGALALAERYPFDLLISDIGLPDGNGYELMETIRERKGDLPALALSGFGTTEDRSRSLQAGFKAHVTKPFNFPDLLKLINELIEQPDER